MAATNGLSRGDGTMLLGLGLLAAAGGLSLYLFTRSKSVDLAKALDIALTKAEALAAAQRQAGFNVMVTGVERWVLFTGKPPNMDQSTWNSVRSGIKGGSETLWWVQVGISYTPPGAGGGENLIYVIEQANANIVTLFQTNTELQSWF